MWQTWTVLSYENKKALKDKEYDSVIFIGCLSHNYDSEGKDRIGYKYTDYAGIPVQFPFGYGLSYTEFAYSREGYKNISTRRI